MQDNELRVGTIALVPLVKGGGERVSSIDLSTNTVKERKILLLDIRNTKLEKKLDPVKFKKYFMSVQPGGLPSLTI